MLRKIILGTSSQIRQDLFRRLQLSFEISHPNIDETPQPDETAECLVNRLAKSKAQKIAVKYNNAIIITCDQVMTVGNKILCKPKNHQDAVQQLQLCSGKPVTSLTGLCVMKSGAQECTQTIEYYSVFFRDLTSSQIESYLEKERPYQCAGSIRAEGLGSALFDKMQGDDPTSLLGLPLIRLTKILEQFNVPVL